MALFEDIESFISENQHEDISEERKEVLQSLVDYIRYKHQKDETVQIVFVCTHNSRRSQLAQVWAETMAYFCGVERVKCYSAGTEKTAVYSEIIKTLERGGFQVEIVNDNQAVYKVKYAGDISSISLSSKKADDILNPSLGFLAVMTCSQADESCPFIAGSDGRISVRYEDPKIYDNTEEEQEKYDKLNKQIAVEMLYVFSKI